jgi:nucleotide-binding universal stress UspA family protein
MARGGRADKLGSMVSEPPRPRTRKRLLLAYDGSPSARRALQRLVTMHRKGDDVGVIHVSDHGSDAAGHLPAAQGLLAERGIAATLLSCGGNPARAICVAAERDDYDTILVGRRNLRDAGLLLGSVAARVVSGAACDVVVVA